MTMPVGDRELWLGLRLIPGVGSVLYSRLLSLFGSPAGVFAAPLARLQAVPRVGEALALCIHGRRWAVEPGRELERLDRLGGRMVTLADGEYPPLLAEIPAPPPVLFVRGDLAGCRGGGVAVVGSRRMTPYGRRVAETLGRDLGEAGISAVSGLARGVDSAVHRGALNAGGHTVGVLGSGLNVAYPPENAELLEDMARRGAVVSEFPLDTGPRAGNFPMRNRVISGLSLAVVVVEAGEKSGALITARHALDQGRDVFAVPGPVGSPFSQGANALLRQGAQVFTGFQDLLAPGAAPGLAGGRVRGREPGGAGRPEPPALPPKSRAVLDLLGDMPLHADMLARESGLAASELASILLGLELDGRIKQLPGNQYVTV